MKVAIGEHYTKFSKTRLACENPIGEEGPKRIANALLKKGTFKLLQTQSNTTPNWKRKQLVAFVCSGYQWQNWESKDSFGKIGGLGLRTNPVVLK